MNLLYTIGIILFALGGLFIAGYIAKTKNKKMQLICPLGHSCDSVIHSRFSHFFGVGVEMIGIFYYLGIVLFYGLSLIFAIPHTIVFYALLVTSLAFIFNLHLIFVQLVVLKKWCTTCLFSSAASFMILVLSFIGFQSSFGNYLFEYHDILNWVFIFMVFVGVITASLHAKTYMKFLRDFEISKREAHRLSMYSHTGWVAITIAFLSGLGLVLTDIYGNITEGSEFMVIIMVLGTLIVYEIIVNLFIGPKLVDVHFGDHPELEDHHHTMLRKTSFAFVAIGVVSWYVLLLLTTVSFYQYSTWFLMLMYVVLLVIGVLVALYAEHLFYKKSVLVEIEQEIE